jgi:hypothetical protein
MNNRANPFITSGYVSKEYFCDREAELETLQNNIKNEVHTTLISNRRLGKSALIYRLFESLEDENYYCIYTDMYATLHLKDFTETLALAVFTKFPEKKGLGKRFFELLTSFRPTLTYNALSGTPELHFEFGQSKEYEHTLRSIFGFLDSLQVNVVLAIDEFQQITGYPEQNTEALLRTIMQTLKNIRIIFIGSRKHLMTEIFNTVKRPFFSSTQMLWLPEIPETSYKSFIRSKFEEHRRTIDDEAIDFILWWTCVHTYYTQIICNGVFANCNSKITLDKVKQVCERQLAMQQFTFMQYRNMLSPVQWQLLLAIAKEGAVSEPQSQKFLQKYKIGSASSAKKALQALISKEMIYTLERQGKTAYRVYDVFFMRWLEQTFHI